MTTFAGTSANTTADNFTYTSVSAPTITDVTPSSGSTTGGTVVTITGTDFTGTTGVTVGGGPSRISRSSRTR